MRPEARSRRLAQASLVVALLSLGACGNSLEVSDGAGAGGCVAGTEQAIAAGKYTQTGLGPGTNVLILLSNGNWCADAMSDGGTALTSEGTWSSALEDGGTGIMITKTNSRYFNIVSCDGQTVMSYRTIDSVFAGFRYGRESPSAYTCDGQ